MDVSIFGNYFTCFFKQKRKSYLFLLFSIFGFVLLSNLGFIIKKIDLFNDNTTAWETIRLKSENPTNDLKHLNPETHASKKVFRLTIPMAMSLFSLSPKLLNYIEIILGFFSYLICFRLVLNITRDKLLSFFVTISISCLYFGRAPFFDYNTWFDGYAYFFLLMAMWSNSFVGVFLFSTLAAWTDERSFIALSIVGLFHFLPFLDFNKTGLIKQKATLNISAVVLSIVFYLIVRQILSVEFNMQTPSEGAGIRVLRKTALFLPLGTWTFLEGFWLLIPALFFSSKNHNPLNVKTVIFFIVLFFILISGMVHDITRSGAYLFPIVFPIIFVLKRELTSCKLRSLMFSVFVVSFLFPPVLVCPGTPIDKWFQTSFNIIFQHVVDFTNHNFSF